MRVVQPQGHRGSLKWLQLAGNRRPDLLENPAIGPVRWLSPIEGDSYAEYRDGAFLELVGLGRLKNELAEFWPSRGPQWDALGMAGSKVVLVEAKAHIAEMLSPPCGAGEASRDRIAATLDGVRSALGVRRGADWTVTFYQLANRIAHLHFLRRAGVEAQLLLVGFVGDRDMGGPASAAEWLAAYQVASYAMGLPAAHALSPFIHHVYPEVQALAAA